MQNNNSKKVWGILGIIIIVILVIVSVNTSKKNKAKVIESTEVNVGVVLGFTGDAAQDSEEMKRGIEMAKTDLEKEGYKVNLNYQDDGTDPKKTVLAVQNMISINRPDFVVGPAWSFLGSAASDIFTQNKLISYQPADTSEYVTSKDYTYHLFGAPKLEKKSQELEKFLSENTFKNALIISMNIEFEQVNRKVYEEALTKKGITMLPTEVIQYGQDISIDTILAKYKNNQPDLILLAAGFEGSSNMLLKKYKQYGYDSTILGDVILSYRSAGDLAREIGKVYMFKTQHNQEFINKYKSVYGTDPGNYSDSAYDGTMQLVKAFVEKGKNTDEVLKHLRSDSYKYKGYQTDYSFDERGDIQSSTWKIEKVQ